jgi:hypothetical protein
VLCAAFVFFPRGDPMRSPSFDETNRPEILELRISVRNHIIVSRINVTQLARVRSCLERRVGTSFGEIARISVPDFAARTVVDVTSGDQVPAATAPRLAANLFDDRNASPRQRGDPSIVMRRS